MKKNIWHVKVDGVETKFTRQDVINYFKQSHGESGLRTFGTVSGDWRMIDIIAQDAAVYFNILIEVEHANGGR